MENMKTAEDILAQKGSELIGVPPETTVQEALAIMTQKRVGAMLVMKEGTIVGIWTERDLMNRTATGGFDPKTALIGDMMTTHLHSAPHDAQAIAPSVAASRIS